MKRSQGLPNERCRRNSHAGSHNRSKRSQRKPWVEVGNACTRAGNGVKDNQRKNKCNNARNTEKVNV